jgi:signal transduction histidine kinase
VESRAGLQTGIQVHGERRLPLAVEEELFWIALEAFNNVVKHACARLVTVELRYDEAAVCLEIADDGRGFDLATASERGGLGLRGIAERAARIQAEFTIMTSPGQGTTLRVEVPVSRGEEREP